MNNSHESKPYLTFSLGDEKFAISINFVQEVVEIGQYTKVPRSPDYMLGIINLRGKVLPLLDTKLKLGLPKTVISKKSRIMVLDLQGYEDRNLQIGALVDLAKEVIEIKENEIQEAPDFQNSQASAPVTGILNNQGDITLIMDVEKVFSVQDIMQIKQSVA